MLRLTNLDRSRLWACADETNEFWVIDVAAGKHTVMAGRYNDKLLDGPNDVWVRPDGGLYFTDPFYKRDYWKRGPIEQDQQAVYYLPPDGKSLTRVTDDLQTGKGVTVFDKNGKQIEHIDVPEAWTANVCFGGKDMHTIFITAATGLYAIKTQTQSASHQ